MLLGVLAQAATKESVDLLLQMAMTLTETELKRVAYSGIRAVGALWGDGTFHEELSPPLERAWRESQDQELIISVAVALAEVGASNGVNLLVNSALDKKSRDEVRARAAQGALGGGATILNPSAVPPLTAVLASQPAGSEVANLATDALARSGIPAASKALLAWLQNADENAAPLAHRYVVHSRSPALLETWESALNPAVPFRSEKNREAVRTGLEVYRSSRR